MPYYNNVGSRMAYGPHVLLLFFTAAVMFILVTLVVFSSPFITSIAFLTNDDVHFGAFGWSSPGYKSSDVLGYEYGQQVLKPITNAMILWGIADIFCLFTLFSIIPLLWVHESAALHAVGSNGFYKVCSWMSAIILGLIWCMSIMGWSAVHRAFNVASADNNPHLGAAIWMGLVATGLAWFIILLGWPADAMGGGMVGAGGGGGPNNYYHYRQTTREVTRPRMAHMA